MSNQRQAGKISFSRNGEIIAVSGAFSYNLGLPERTALVGQDTVHGYSELPRVPFFEGEIRHMRGISLTDLQQLADETLTLTLANGTTIVLSDAWAAGEWTGNTEESNVPARFEGIEAEEILGAS